MLANIYQVPTRFQIYIRSIIYVSFNSHKTNYLHLQRRKTVVEEQSTPKPNTYLFRFLLDSYRV